MHVLIVGANGQLGRSVRAVLEREQNWEITCWSHDDADIADPNISAEIERAAPDIVINAAAWTDVDGAEDCPDAAYAVNALGPHYLATGCTRAKAIFVHFSTNEVFSGEAGCSYREYDTPSPGGVYACSKRAGEVAALSACARTYVVRVAWLFGPGGSHFPRKIVSAADKLGALRVVDDEFGNPTYTPDVADSLMRLLDSQLFGIYHVVNEGIASRFEFAREFLRVTGREDVPVTPIPSSEWQRRATPPLHSVLVNQAAASLGIRLRPWRDALVEYARSYPTDFGIRKLGESSKEA